MARWVAADLYAREIDALRAELSIGAASDELREMAGNAAEPYRAILRGVAARLRATRAYAAAQIEHADGDQAPRLRSSRPTSSRPRCWPAIARSWRPAIG